MISSLECSRKLSREENECKAILIGLIVIFAFMFFRGFAFWFFFYL